MLSAPLLALVVAHVQNEGGYTIVEAHRTMAFAGKLGKRVEDHLVVERDGVRYRVEIGHRHTRFGSVGAEYSAGDRIKVQGTFVSGTLIAMPENVKKL